MKTTQEKIAVMQAFISGSNICKAAKGSTQIVAFFSNKDTKNPVWDWKNFDYDVEKTDLKKKDSCKPVNVPWAHSYIWSYRIA